MPARIRFPVASGALLGALAGALVGTVDGMRAAIVFGVDGRSAAAVVALSVAVDALAGFAVGAVVELLARLALWGRRVRAPLAARGFAFVVAGAGAMAATGAVIAAVVSRHNRFLAAGLAALAALAAALLGALLAPALARLVSRRRAEQEVGAPSPALLLLAPLAAAVLCAAIFLQLWRVRVFPWGPALPRFIARVAAPAFLLPWALARVAAVRVPLRWRWAGVVGVVVYGGLGAFGLAKNWSDNLRFAPWNDLDVGAAIVGVALLLAWLARSRLPRARGRVAALSAATFVAAVALLLRVSASEAARKAGEARAGLVGPTLEVGRALLDRDGDGYAGWLGGGDCDDSDPSVHPEALDFPNDGIDSDCDGQDSAAGIPPPAAMVPVPASVPPNLNLLFVTIDTLRADHLGCYGYARPTSPEIDRFAGESTLFVNGWAHAPSTRYSMPALASGRWPSAIDWDNSIWWPRLGRGVRTIAEALHDDGYFTGGLFSFTYFQASDRRGFERGMDYYNTDRAALHVAVNGPMESRGTSSREMADDAIAFVDAHKDRKFFLWLHFYDPHLSYEPHPEVPSFGTDRMDLYDGEIRFTDMHVGRLLAHLKQIGLWDKTAIVLTGDHGEGFGEHGITEHGFDLYTAQTRVPFIVRVPGLPAQKSLVPVGHIDVAPTLVNLARGKPEPSFFGRSLVPELAGARPADEATRWVFQEVTSERGKKRALVTSTRHLIWNWVPSNTTECYDRVADPGETHDLWGRWGAAGDACTTLKGDLQRLVAALALPTGVAEKMARGVTPPGATPPRPTHALDAMLGDEIQVRGYDVVPEVVPPGSQVTVTYHFTSKKRTGPRWQLFFHLEGPGGYRNLDHIPVDGLMPLERWRPGQAIRDTYRISLPPNAPRGTYTLFLGAYRGRDHLAVSPKTLADAAGRLRLGTFVVR
ncbi:MAG TPA: sulfatase-like hydrolase/transferase [Polyangia bacterium]|jgi:arylsulfatase A-like enzyme/MFS family permease|nr:sulfatase-like hydrolase/transferase [Polyangia bacterium]